MAGKFLAVGAWCLAVGWLAWKGFVRGWLESRHTIRLLEEMAEKERRADELAAQDTPPEAGSSVPMSREDHPSPNAQQRPISSTLLASPGALTDRTRGIQRSAVRAEGDER